MMKLSNFNKENESSLINQKRNFTESEYENFDYPINKKLSTTSKQMEMISTKKSVGNN